MSSDSKYFTKNELDHYLYEVAKEYNRLGRRKVPDAEVVLVGGAAIISLYSFRAMTNDADAIFRASSICKDAVRNVGRKFNLGDDWLNDDFKYTTSFSYKLIEHSSFLKTYCGKLHVRTVTPDYLIATKLNAGRKYKRDLSDIIGVFSERRKGGESIEAFAERVRNAYLDMYGDIEQMPDVSKKVLLTIENTSDLESLYTEFVSKETENQSLLLDFEKRYPAVLKTDNVEKILYNLTAGKQASEDFFVEYQEMISHLNRMKQEGEKAAALYLQTGGSEQLNNLITIINSINETEKSAYSCIEKLSSETIAADNEYNLVECFDSVMELASDITEDLLQDVEIGENDAVCNQLLTSRQNKFNGTDQTGDETEAGEER